MKSLIRIDEKRIIYRVDLRGCSVQQWRNKIAICDKIGRAILKTISVPKEWGTGWLWVLDDEGIAIYGPKKKQENDTQCQILEMAKKLP